MICSYVVATVYGPQSPSKISWSSASQLTAREWYKQFRSRVKVHSFSPHLITSSRKASPRWDRHQYLRAHSFSSVHCSEQQFPQTSISFQKPAPDNAAQNPLCALKHSLRRMAGKLENAVPFQSFVSRLFFFSGCHSCDQMEVSLCNQSCQMDGSIESYQQLAPL